MFPQRSSTRLARTNSPSGAEPCRIRPMVDGLWLQALAEHPRIGITRCNMISRSMRQAASRMTVAVFKSAPSWFPQPRRTRSGRRLPCCPPALATARLPSGRRRVPTGPPLPTGSRRCRSCSPSCQACQPHRRVHRVSHRSFLAPPPTLHAAAAALSLPPTTFRRHLRAADERLTELMGSKNSATTPPPPPRDESRWVKHSRWALVKDPAKLKPSQLDVLHALRDHRPATHRKVRSPLIPRGMTGGALRTPRRRRGRQRLPAMWVSSQFSTSVKTSSRLVSLSVSWRASG